MLKTFQRLGHFAQPDDVPPIIVAHIAAATALGDGVAEFDAYGTASSYRSRLMTLVRDYVGVAAYGPPARKAATVAAIEVSRGRDDLADIVNAAIEELARRRFELPAFSTLLKIARTVRALVNRGYHRQAASAMTPETRERLLTLLAVPNDQPRSAWDVVKSEPERPSPARMRAFLLHLRWLLASALAARADGRQCACRRPRPEASAVRGRGAQLERGRPVTDSRDLSPAAPSVVSLTLGPRAAPGKS